MCTAGTSATHSCTFTIAGPYTMQVTPLGGSPVSCPAVVAGVPSAYITATPDRVNSGSSSTLSFSGDQIATSCTVTGPGGVTLWGPTAPSGGAVATSSVSTGPITAQSTYTISCDGGAATHSTIVNIVAKFEEF
jgi:hypothetical protein